ncbi:Similar to Transcription factor 25; acc. no. Q8R3L2 [Pyronema omphalodes CBS 100304]|uniref:Similar to Transcription factor 25 acc. no. Q8R3L2 n=1 Tax=Pyronema omphalodes (strain CBS 100304) TaxID=1076935 RepID=U4LML0_PYROM|nr:Similar to Transcription factor 25; acc. no. Q8R3L2 [Pyronema omphalodes CBS 100304]
MSSRALRKARELELLKSNARGPASEEVSESEDDEPAPTAKPSLFALLDIPDERDQDDEDEEAESEPKPEKPVVTASKSKKKNKKKKAKGKAKAAEEDEEKEDDDDIDRALKELSLAPLKKPSQKSTAEPQEQPLSSVLKIDSRNLDAGNEMMRLFGKDALKNIEGDERPRGGAARQAGARLQRIPGSGGRALNKGRKNTFVQPKDDWPNSGSGGLGMEIEHSDPETGITYYRFVHSKTYQGVQREFRICVEAMDPDRMIALLQHNPYHITTLLQCSEIFHHQRDYNVAGDLLERALFSLGRSLHSTFQQKLSEGTARLSFFRPENRELWLCGWRYIKNLAQRGTWRTAEEFARLLLAMDPEEDPYEMSLIIDFLALKSRQPDVILGLAEHSALQEKYSDLPNIAFSSALAQVQLGNTTKAHEYLAKAIAKFPWMPHLLYGELGIDADLPGALWGQILPEDNIRQQILSKLYIERTKDLWKHPDFEKFLVEGVSKFNSPLQDVSLLSSARKDVSLSLARHVLLTDIPAITTLIPRSITQRPTHVFDPLPPHDNLPSYELMSSSLPTANASTPAPDLSMLPGGGTLGGLLANILPWFRAAEQGQTDRGEPLTDSDRAHLDELRNELTMSGINIDDFLREAQEDEQEDEQR